MNLQHCIVFPTLGFRYRYSVDNETRARASAFVNITSPGGSVPITRPFVPIMQHLVIGPKRFYFVQLLQAADDSFSDSVQFRIEVLNLYSIPYKKDISY